MKDFVRIKEHVLSKLKTELAADLYYHGPHHTLDVLHAAETIGAVENLNQNDMLLLKVAALYHDIGFIKTYKNHEEAGCAIAKEDLSAFGFTMADIDTVCGMILATKIPQTPTTQLQRIIADADLDYLGRNDFEAISSSLYKEMKIYLNIKTDKEWYTIQANFLKTHHYFTAYAKSSLEPEKQKHLQRIVTLLSNII